MKKTLIAVAMVMSGAALATAPQAQPQPLVRAQPQHGPGRMEHGPMEQDSAEDRQRREQRHRIAQVVRLTEELGLNTQEALRIDEILKRFDERRRPLREQVHASGKVLKDAARGDAAALAQVDQATTRILDARIQLATLDKEQFQALAKDLSPQQRARLAVFYAKLHKMKGAKMMMMRGHGPDGSEGRRVPHFRMRRGEQPLGLLEGSPSELGLLADGPEGQAEETEL